jgi:hypothetical protein
VYVQAAINKYKTQTLYPHIAALLHTPRVNIEKQLAHQRYSLYVPRYSVYLLYWCTYKT